MSANDRGPQGPPSPRLELRVVPAPKQGILIIRFLGPVRGILTHWSKKRPLACPGPLSCPTTVHRSRAEWKGYAPAEQWRDAKQDWLPCVFEVTENLWRDLQTHQLRGQLWKIARELVKPPRTTRVVGELAEEHNGDLFPPAFSIEAAIWRLYGTKEIAFDLDPDIPPPELIVPNKGPRPSFLGTPKKEESEPAVTRLTMEEARKLYSRNGTTAK